MDVFTYNTISLVQFFIVYLEAENMVCQANEIDPAKIRFTRSPLLKKEKCRDDREESVKKAGKRPYSRECPKCWENSFYSL
jgi:hypothetical protein